MQNNGIVSILPVGCSRGSFFFQIHLLLTNSCSSIKNSNDSLLSFRFSLRVHLHISLLTCCAAAHFCDWLVVGWSFSRNGDNQMWSVESLFHTSHVSSTYLCCRPVCSFHTAHVSGAVLCSKRGTSSWILAVFISKELILYKSRGSRFTLFVIALHFFGAFRVKWWPVLCFWRKILYCTRLVLHRHQHPVVKHNKNT